MVDESILENINIYMVDESILENINIDMVDESILENINIMDMVDESILENINIIDMVDECILEFFKNSFQTLKTFYGVYMLRKSSNSIFKFSGLYISVACFSESIKKMNYLITATKILQ